MKIFDEIRRIDRSGVGDISIKNLTKKSRPIRPHGKIAKSRVLRHRSDFSNSKKIQNLASSEGKGLSHYSSLFVSDHGRMICVRCESEHAELFLSMYCCDSLAIGPGGGGAAPQRRVSAAASPGGENFVIRWHSVFIGS